MSASIFLDSKKEVKELTKKTSENTKQMTWRSVRFGDIVRNVNETVQNPLEQGIERFVGLEHLDPESLHIKRWGNVADGTSFTRKFVSGQILFGKRRAYQRKAAVADFDGICSGDILVFEPNGDELLPELLPFVVQSDGFFEHALGTSAGSLSPRTKWSDLARYEFALPPKDEQRRIAEILWSNDECSRLFERANEQTALLNQVIFTQSLQDLSDKTEVKFSELMLGSPQSGFSAVSAPQHTGHFVLSLSALSNSGYKGGFYKPVELVSEVQATRLKKSDLLISRSNTIELVGLCGIFCENRTDVSFPDTMMRLNVDEHRINKKFLVQFLLSGNGRRQIQRVAAGTSASMKKINRSGLASIKIPLPSLDNQEEVMMKIEASNKSNSAIQNNIQSLKSLKNILIEHFIK